MTINLSNGLEPGCRREMSRREMEERGLIDGPSYTAAHEDPIAVLWRDSQDRSSYDRLSDLIDDLADDDMLRSHFVRAHRMPWVGPWVEITSEVEAAVEERLCDIRTDRAHDSAGCGMQRP